MRYMLFDRWGNPLGDLPYAIKAIRTRATDATDTLDITTIGEINKDERIVFKDSMGRWAEYLCQSTQTARAAGMPVTVAYCTGSIAELSRTYIEDKRNRKANAKACLTKALEGTRWAVGTVETGTITGTADLAFYHCTVLDAVQKTADTYGLEVQTEYQPDPTGNQIGRRIIHLVEHRGSTNTTKRFEYGKDLTQIKRDIDSGDVITRLYGWGKGIEQTNDQGEATGGYSRKISFADVNDGKPYVQDDQALANWGIPGPDGTKHHSEASVDFPDCEDPKELLTLTKNALKTRTTPVVSYTADVTALGQAGLSAEGTDVGDGVQIIDTSFTTPLRLEGRILQIEEDLAGSLADTKITLGNIRQSYTQRLAAQQQALDKLVSNSGAWNSAAGGAGPYMKDLIDRINQIMNATGGYTYLKPGQGIYVYDKPEDQNPTQCIHIGGGYWRIADHKKANGDWDFRSLANGKGIFADTIFTGRLSGAAGLNYWDLDTGRFVMTDANGNETVHLDGNGAGNLLVGTFQTARTGKRVRISPDFDSYQIGGTETYDGSGISFPLDGAYASSPSIWSYSRSNKTGDMSGLAMLSGYRTAGTPRRVRTILEPQVPQRHQQDRIAGVPHGQHRILQGLHHRQRRQPRPLLTARPRRRGNPKRMVPVRHLPRRSQSHRQQGESLRHRRRRQWRNRTGRRHQHRIHVPRRLPRRHQRTKHLPNGMVGKQERRTHDIQPVHLHILQSRKIRLLQGARHRGPPRRRLGADLEHRIRLRGQRLARLGIHRAGEGRHRSHRPLE